MRRVMYPWLPLWPIDRRRLSRRKGSGAPAEEVPFATIADAAGRRLLDAVNPTAAAAGLATLDIYDRTAQFLRAADLGEAELTRNIIGTIGEVDTYRLPDAKGFASMQRYLIGDTDESRQRMREEILSTTAADIRNFGDAMAQVAAKGRVVVLGAEQAIEAANAERPGLLRVSRVL